jgi:molybdopterin-binding protein
MQLSARNQLTGRVVTLRTDGLMAEVTLELPGGQRLVSVITRASAEALGLREGDEAVAVIKSTEIMVAK